MILKRVMKDNFGSILVSVILGLGLAALFRRVCTGDNCVVVRAPSSKEIDDYVYRVGAPSGPGGGGSASCYKYTPNIVPCKMGAGPKGAQDDE